MGCVVELRKYVDGQSGELIAKTEKLLPDYFDPDNGYKMMARTKNIRIFPNIVFPEELDRIDMGHLLYLSRYMWANTGVLGKVTNRQFRPFGDEELIECVGFKNNRRGKEWLKKMTKLSMLRSIDINMPDGSTERQWYLNPLYFCPMFITRQAYLIWHDQIDKFMPDYVKKIFRHDSVRYDSSRYDSLRDNSLRGQ